MFDPDTRSSRGQPHARDGRTKKTALIASMSIVAALVAAVVTWVVVRTLRRGRAVKQMFAPSMLNKTNARKPWLGMSIVLPGGVFLSGPSGSGDAHAKATVAWVPAKSPDHRVTLEGHPDVAMGHLCVGLVSRETEKTPTTIHYLTVSPGSEKLAWTTTTVPVGTATLKALASAPATVALAWTPEGAMKLGLFANTKGISGGGSESDKAPGRLVWVSGEGSSTSSDIAQAAEVSVGGHVTIHMMNPPEGATPEKPAQKGFATLESLRSGAKVGLEILNE